MCSVWSETVSGAAAKSLSKIITEPSDLSFVARILITSRAIIHVFLAIANTLTLALSRTPSVITRSSVTDFAQ